MEIYTTGQPSEIYENLRSLDRDSRGLYDVTRGMNSILNSTYLPFNHFDYLQQRVAATKGRVRVFEGGCGIAQALVDLKRGLTYSAMLYSRRDNRPSRVVEWAQRLEGRVFPGLADEIHTAGITLTEDHLERLLVNDPAYLPNKVVVGTLEHYARITEDRYDLVFDSYGAAYHTPLEAATAYGRLLDTGGLGIIRVVDGFPEDLDTVAGMLKMAGLRVIDQGTALDYPAEPVVELLFEKP